MKVKTIITTALISLVSAVAFCAAPGTTKLGKLTDSDYVVTDGAKSAQAAITDSYIEGLGFKKNPGNYEAVSNAAMSAKATLDEKSGTWDAKQDVIPDYTATNDVKEIALYPATNYTDRVTSNLLTNDVAALTNSVAFTDAVRIASPSVELPQKWALANVTNANAESVRASDVGALGNSGSQTLNQSYGGLSVNFDSKGTLYTGQYAPSRWSITKEVNDQYYYVQFFGFSRTNYPSFNLFDGESDFYIRLPRKEGTLALQSDVESKADKPALPVTDGNLAALTADGNLADSGKSAGELASVTNPIPFYVGLAEDGMPNYFKVVNDSGDTLLSIGTAGDWRIRNLHRTISSDSGYEFHYRANGEDESASNEIAVKGDIADKADRIELGGYLPLTGGTITGNLHVNESLGVGYNLHATFFSTAYNTIWGDVVPALYYSRWYYLPNGSEYPKMSDNEIAVKGDISATNPTFSDAVKTVVQEMIKEKVKDLNAETATVKQLVEVLQSIYQQ